MNDIVGTWPIWLSSVVVAVPVCRPARPTRAHPSLAVQAKVETQCLRMAAPHFWYGNAAARTFGRAHRHRPYHSNTCRHSAKVKTKILMLAVTLQALKRENIVPAPHGDDKMAKILFPRCTATIKWHKYCFRAARRR